jgi:hypothetical protein
MNVLLPHPLRLLLQRRRCRSRVLFRHLRSASRHLL